MEPSESSETQNDGKSTPLRRALWTQGVKNLNFLKIHVIAFTLIPVICASILYACNGRFPIPFVDALFICISAASGTGLTTADLSALTAWQQSIVAGLTIAGSPTTVAWLVVLVRKHYFTSHLDDIVKRELNRSATASSILDLRSLRVKGKDIRLKNGSLASNIQSPSKDELPGPHQRAIHIPDSMQSTDTIHPQSLSIPTSDNRAHTSSLLNIPRITVTHHGILTNPSTPISPSSPFPDDRTQAGATSVRFSPNMYQDIRRRESNIQLRRAARQQSLQLHAAAGLPAPALESEDRGGFCNPLQLLDACLRHTAPNLRQAIRRKLTMPTRETFLGDPCPQPIDREHGYGAGSLEPGRDSKRVPYLMPGTSLSIRTGSTVSFEGLTEQDYEELGGVEYQALRLLVWLVPCFYLITVTLGFAVLAPYTAMPRWKETFLPPTQHRPVNSTWYSLFVLISSWGNTGMSIVDQNLIPFQRAYPLLITVIIVAILGETGFPAGLRFIVWTLSHLTRRDGRTYAAMKFLLDHPRRCFILLFPSRQTWFLLTVLIGLNLADWTAFLVLDIGIPEIEAIPIGVRMLLGVVQAVALRIAGFTAFSLATLAPAMKILYLIMMYIAVFPVAMSVRATNVYEEKSLGIFEEEGDDELMKDIENDAAYPESDGRVAIWGRYLGRHVRHQLSHDLWWLMFALIVVATVERANIRNPASDPWFNLFTIIFETVSAYTCVGLSFGIPTANYSLSGAFSTPSKVIMCAIMLRGRHRGLPLKVDRSIMLPQEFERDNRQHLGRLRTLHSGSTSGLSMTSFAPGSMRTPVSPMALEQLPTVKESANEKEEDECGQSNEGPRGTGELKPDEKSE